MDLVSAITGAGANGWGQAGAAMGKMFDPNSANAAQMKGYEQGLSLQTKLATARKARDEAMARERVQQRLSDAGVPAEAAALISDVFRGGGTFQGAVSGYGDILKQGGTRQALESATSGAPDLDLINAINMATNGKVVDLTKVQGNTTFNPLLSPNNPRQSMETTDYGSEYLQNQRTRTATQAETSRRGQDIRASTAASSGAAKRADAARKAAARDAFLDAKANGADLKGVTQADVEFAFRKNGEWSSPDGNTYAYDDEDVGGGADAINQDDDVDLPPASTTAPDIESVIRSNAGMTASPAASAGGAYNPPQSVPLSYASPAAKKEADAIDLYERAAAGAYAGTSSNRYGGTSAPPPQALARLKEGIVTTFGNGEKWTLQNGQPVKVQ